jgi:epoxyqueuosine reductase
MEEDRVHYEQWLAQGFAAGMGYLERNPQLRTSPQMLFPQSRSAIIVSVSYYTPVPASPGLGYGRVARYAVGLDYHAVLRAKLRELKTRIEKALGRPLIGKACTDDVALYEQAFAARHGLGFSGKNTMIIGPKLSGSYYFVAELFTDLELEPDEPYNGTCGQCFRCAAACPTNAIVAPSTLNAGLCISYLTIENKGGIPLELRAKLGDWVFGCDVCQEVCPYNQNPPQSPWSEFQPERGAGHYLDLISLLKIRSDEEFVRRFGHTPLRRPKRRGLLRNALVALGNQLSQHAGGAGETGAHMVDHVINEIGQFALIESDEMLKDHARWAISQSN